MVLAQAVWAQPAGKRALPPRLGAGRAKQAQKLALIERLLNLVQVEAGFLRLLAETGVGAQVDQSLLHSSLHVFDRDVF